MVLLAALLLCQDPAADIDRLVRDLSHELIEVRERAQARLLSLGEPAIPALRRAVPSDDAEFHLRATTLLETIDRINRERIHDADQKAALLLLHRTQTDIAWERSPGSAATEGARFCLAATAFNDGWVVSTAVTDYLARRLDPGPGRGFIRFDVRSIRDPKGSELTIERCGRCSPKKVFVRKTSGPFKILIAGAQTWFSPYHFEFKDPAEGHSKRVGDYTIAVAWPALTVTTSREFPAEWLSSMSRPFKATFKDGLHENAMAMGKAIG